MFWETMLGLSTAVSVRLVVDPGTQILSFQKPVDHCRPVGRGTVPRPPPFLHTKRGFGYPYLGQVPTTSTRVFPPVRFGGRNRKELMHLIGLFENADRTLTKGVGGKANLPVALVIKYLLG